MIEKEINKLELYGEFVIEDNLEEVSVLDILKKLKEKGYDCVFFPKNCKIVLRKLKWRYD